MSKKVLQKVIDNLKSPNPDLSYVRGLLEALIESMPEERPLIPMPIPTIGSLIAKNIPADEGERMEMEAKAKLANIKGLI
jgi:hypothetical protein